MKLITFILPVYNESENIYKLWEELQSIKKDLKDYKFEYVFINDFSNDDSLSKLEQLYQENPSQVIVINFSRNYGHQIAVTAGQDISTGDAVIVMDTDLQDPPSVCIELIEKWESGYDVVYAQRKKYETNILKKTSAFLFYRLMSKIANIKIPVDTGDFGLLSKRVNDEMKKYKEKSRFLRGISSLVGLKQTSVLFDRENRFGGKPGYTFGKSLKLAMDGITGFSTVPLRVISSIGSLLAFGSIVFGLGYVIWAVFTKSAILGWPSIISAIYFLGGVQLIMLGIIGEYVGRIYIQVLDRPLYTVDKIYSSK